MLIKPKYSPGDKAPMKWCTWQMFLLPIGALLSLISFVTQASDSFGILKTQGFPAYGVFTFVLSSAAMAGQCLLALFAANALGRMEWRGPQCVYLLCPYDAAPPILSGFLGWMTFAEVLGRCLGDLIIFSLQYIYYQKRRNLFTPLPIQQPPPARPGSTHGQSTASHYAPAGARLSAQALPAPPQPDAPGGADGPSRVRAPGPGAAQEKTLLPQTLLHSSRRRLHCQPGRECRSVFRAKTAFSAIQYVAADNPRPSKKGGAI